MEDIELEAKVAVKVKSFHMTRVLNTNTETRTTSRQQYNLKISYPLRLPHCHYFGLERPLSTVCETSCLSFSYSPGIKTDGVFGRRRQTKFCK